MHLQSKILVEQNIKLVTDFFYEPSSLAKWDRSVMEMIPISSDTNAVGSTFDTIAPSGMRMNYEVIEMKSERSVKIKLNNSKMFKTATWHFEFAPVEEKTLITCHVYFTPRLKYFILYPVLYFTRSALLRDLNFLKEALDKNYGSAPVI
jgi:hypothetical protein